MKKLSAVLVDDMPEALDVLKADIATYCPNVEVRGTAESVVAAAKLIKQTQPDILFLDIMLGADTGFDLLEILPDTNFQLIFVTAHNEFAIQAFRFSAVDYLLKPIDPDQLQEAVNKAADRAAISSESLELLKSQIQNPNRLAAKISLPTQERINVVDINQIVRCESLDNNTRFFLENGEQIFVTRTLKKFELLLKDHPFFRVHQSHLINLNQLDTFEKKDGGYIKMKNGDIVPVSVRKRPEVIRALEDMNS